MLWDGTTQLNLDNLMQFKRLSQKQLQETTQKGLHHTSQIEHRIPKITFSPPFFVLARFTNFNILVNLGCCESGGGVTKTDISDKLRMENGCSDENVSTSKMTTSSRDILTSLS